MTSPNGIDSPPKSALKYTCTDCGGEGMGRWSEGYRGHKWWREFDPRARCMGCFGTGPMPMSLSEAMKMRADAAQKRQVEIVDEMGRTIMGEKGR